MQRFLKPASGIYEQVAKPYKKLFQEIKMTFDIEIQGKRYRIVGFYPWFKNGLGPFSVKRYIVVDQQGQINKNEEIVRLCTQAYLILTSMIQSEDIILMDYSGQDKLAEEYEQLMREITEQVSPHIQGKIPDEIREHFRRMINFYSKSRETEIEMDRLTKTAAPLYNKILEKQYITNEELEELSRTYLEITKVSNERAILVVDTKVDRGVVRGIIRSSDYSKFIEPRLQNQYPKLFGTFDGADKAYQYALVNNNINGRWRSKDLVKDMQAQPYDWLTERVGEYVTNRWQR